MNDDLLKISLNQGKQFNTYQTKVKKIKKTNKHYKKEGFTNLQEQEQIVRPNYDGYVPVLKNLQQTTELTNKTQQKDLDELKQLQTNYDNLSQQYTDIQKKIGDSLQSDQLVYDNIKSKLVILGNDIVSKMENLYNQDNKIFEKLNTNETQFNKDLEMYKLTNLKTNNSIKEGIQNMNDLNGMLFDSDLFVLQGNYSYIMWCILAIGILTVTINAMKK